MFHPLPARPGTCTPAPLPPTTLPPNVTGIDDESPEAGPSRIPYPALKVPSTTACVICDLPPKYTCPKCRYRTCSLACSKSHKTKFSCSGERNPTGYIPLKAVGQGTWAGDYKWLEEGRRKVAKWGEELPKDLLRAEVQQADRGRGGFRGRGGRGAPRGRTSHADKRTMGLERELGKRGIKVEFMPEGMDRRKTNQSTWNMKTSTLHLTVQLSLDSELSGEGQEKTITARVLVSKPDPQLDLATLRSLLPPDVQPEGIVFVLPIPPSHAEGLSLSPGAQHFFPPLDPTKSIIEALIGTAFIEFPTIIVMPRSRWDDQVKSDQAQTVPVLETQPRISQADQGMKRKREEDTATGVPAPKSGVNDLLAGLGGYASGSEDEEEEDKEVEQTT